MASVTCTQQCYFYIDGVQQSTKTYTETLTPGLTYTPSHPNHMPSYDTSVYTEYTITYNGEDYTTGSFTCPDTDFKVKYKFYGYSDTNWAIGSTPEYLDTDATVEKYLSFGKAGYVARIKVSFVHSGKAVFYTTGDADTYGYLSTVSTLDPQLGGPTEILKENDDAGSGSNFRITYNVTAGTIYYLWVRLIYIEDTGTTTVYIKPPPQWKLGVTSDYSNLSSSVSRDLSFGTAGYVARFKVSFANSGEATFYTTGTDDTYGYLSKVSTLDTENGGPTTILAEGDDSGTDRNFSFTYNVTAGTTYYFWVRLIYIDETGTTTAHITPPGGVGSISRWDWNSSNGQASSSATKAAYTAITNNGETSSFSYLVWNDIVDKVLEVLEASGENWDRNGSTYLTAESTKMTSSDKVLTAARFNSLRWNIGLHSSTGISDRSKGDIVYGNYFTKLTSALNSWIDTIN